MTLGTCICQVGPYFCTNLTVHNVSTPLAMDSFLHAKSRIRATFLSSSTSSNPVITFFIFSINSCLSQFNALHLIRRCFISSTSPLSHSVHFLSSLFKPLHLPTSTCSSIFYATPYCPLSNQFTALAVSPPALNTMYMQLVYCIRMWMYIPA